MDAVGDAIKAEGKTGISLRCTKFTRKDGFYTDRLRERFGLEVVTPDPEDRATIDGIIYKELVRGVVDELSRRQYETIIGGHVERGAQGVIRGCTEIGLLVKEQACTL